VATLIATNQSTNSAAKQSHSRAKAKAKAGKSSRAGRRLHGKCYFSDLLFGVGVAC